jgi:toxin ParE1/3/4
MAVIRRTPAARQDLFNIGLYISERNPMAADKLLDTFESKFSALAHMPKTGAARPDVGDGMRHFPVGRYLILYREIPDGIEVVRVVHGARVLGQIDFAKEHSENL